MLKLTLDLVPHGDEFRTKRLGTMLIGNTLGGTVADGEYTARMSDPGSLDKTAPETRVECSITGFQRLSKSPWELVALILRTLKYGV